MVMRLRYSPYPPEQYTAKYLGATFGYGAHPPLAGNLAAWNLFWLSHPPLDLLLTWPEDKGGDVPHCSDLAEACIEAVRRVIEGKALSVLLVGRPIDFATFLNKIPVGPLRVLLPYLAADPAWRSTVLSRAAVAEARLGSQTSTLVRGALLAGALVELDVKQAVLRASNVLEFRRR